MQGWGGHKKFGVVCTNIPWDQIGGLGNMIGG